MGTVCCLQTTTLTAGLGKKGSVAPAANPSPSNEKISCISVLSIPRVIYTHVHGQLLDAPLTSITPALCSSTLLRPIVRRPCLKLLHSGRLKLSPQPQTHEPWLPNTKPQLASHLALRHFFQHLSSSRSGPCGGLVLICNATLASTRPVCGAGPPASLHRSIGPLVSLSNRAMFKYPSTISRLTIGRLCRQGLCLTRCDYRISHANFIVARPRSPIRRIMTTSLGNWCNCMVRAGGNSTHDTAVNSGS